MRGLDIFSLFFFFLKVLFLLVDIAVVNSWIIITNRRQLDLRFSRPNKVFVQFTHSATMSQPQWRIAVGCDVSLVLAALSTPFCPF